MHKKEILRLANKVKEKGLALIPLKMYLKGMQLYRVYLSAVV